MAVEERSNAMAVYWAQRFAAPAEQAVFVAAFEAVQEALAAGDTVLAYAAQDLPLDNDLLVADSRKNQSAAPLVFDGKRLWLQRIWQAERQLAADIRARLQAAVAPLDVSAEMLAEYSAGLNAEQQQAVAKALQQSFTMILGGPGTGKTHTLARLVALLSAGGQAQHLALAAPTGKAAKRMEAALSAALVQANWQGQMPQAQTLHRLLGIGGHGRPQYGRENRLPYDVLIIDEASMLSLELAAQLFAAVSEDCRLILLGDANQLAAVEAGAVLQDLSRHCALQAVQVQLIESKRFESASGIGRLAQLVLGAADEAALQACFEQYADIECCDIAHDSYQRLAQGYAAYFQALQSGVAVEDLLEIFDAYRILTASHHGALGAESINQQMRQQHLRLTQAVEKNGYFHGLPLMIGANDYRNEVFNGDIGLCLRDAQGQFRLHLPHKTLLLEQLNPTQLQPAYALTIHKSQGSEFAHVALVLDGKQDKLLSRELLYTGITRAKAMLSIHAQRETLLQAIDHVSARHTGLAAFL